GAGDPAGAPVSGAAPATAVDGPGCVSRAVVRTGVGAAAAPAARATGHSAGPAVAAAGPAGSAAAAARAGRAPAPGRTAGADWWDRALLVGADVERGARRPRGPQ